MRRLLPLGPLCLAIFACKPAAPTSSERKPRSLRPNSSGNDLPKEAPAQTSEQVRALWLSTPFWDLNNENKENFARYLATQKVNKVFLSIYSPGIARWQSPVLLKNEIATSKAEADLLQAVSAFRRNGIEVSAFFEGGLSLPLSSNFAKKNVQLLQRCGAGTISGEGDGRQYSFLDPSNPTARGIILSALEELARSPIGFKEIQLDRFRYTHRDSKICVASDGTSNPEHVNEFVKHAYQKIKSVNANILVTASPVGSYGYWKHHQSWGQWVQGGYIDGIEAQAYFPHQPLGDCAQGKPPSDARKITLALFKGELATLSGKPNLLNEAFADLKALGADGESLLNASERRPLALAREKEMASPPKSFRLSIGVAAHSSGDKECVQEQIKLARDQGFKNIVLWVSDIAPDKKGKPNAAIDENLSALRDSYWKD